MNTVFHRLRVCTAAGLLAAIALSAFPLRGGAQTIPKTGANLGGFSYYTCHFPFGDCMKQAGPWKEGHTNQGLDRTVPATSIDGNGYVKQMPVGLDAIFCWIAYDNAELKSNNWTTIFPNNPTRTPGGTWVVTWDGNGSVHLLENGRRPENPGPNVALQPGGTSNRKTYVVAPGAGLALVITQIGAPYPSNIRVWMPGQEGKLFHTDYLNSLKRSDGSGRFEILRFMSWGITNDSTAKSWPQDRKTRSYRTYAPDLGNPGGVPYEVMLELCNVLGCHMWVCVPHAADNNYVTKLANLIRYGDERGSAYINNAQRLRDNLLVIAEYTNEPWNNFKQNAWIRDNIAAPDPARSTTMNKYGKRSREVWGMMEAVLGDSRVITTLGCQGGNSGNAVGAARGAENRDAPALPPNPPSTYVETMAISYYFGGEIANEVWNNNWHGTNNRDATFAALQRSFDVEVQKRFAANSYSDKGVAQAWGASLIGYEGNCHFKPTKENGTQWASDAFLKFVFDIYEDPRMSMMIRKMLDRFNAEGVRGMCAFVDTGKWSRDGCWGFKRRPGQATSNWNQLVNWTDSIRTGSSVNRHQAEHAAVFGAPVVSGGGSQGSFVDFTAANQYVEYTLTTSNAGQRTMTLRFANGRPSNYTSGWTISVNGAAPVTAWTANTVAWTTWASMNQTITLNAGINTVRISSLYDHSSHLDWIEISDTRRD